MGEGLPTEAEGASRKVSSESSPGPCTLGGGAGPVFSPNSYSFCYKAEQGLTTALRVSSFSVSNLCLPSVL